MHRTISVSYMKIAWILNNLVRRQLDYIFRIEIISMLMRRLILARCVKIINLMRRLRNGTLRLLIKVMLMHRITSV